MKAEPILKTEINRPWWYRVFRAIGGFVYRFWWLVWLIFIIYLIAWYFLCYRIGTYNCSYLDKITGSIKSVQLHLDDCCNCAEISPPTPPPAKIPENVKPCDFDATNKGGKGKTETKHNLGSSPGNVNINYNMEFQPDQMDVYYDGQLVASTNTLVSGSNSLSFYYPALPGKPTYCTVVITAPQDGTVWSYFIGCPR